MTPNTVTTLLATCFIEMVSLSTRALSRHFLGRVTALLGTGGNPALSQLLLEELSWKEFLLRPNEDRDSSMMSAPDVKGKSRNRCPWQRRCFLARG